MTGPNQVTDTNPRPGGRLCGSTNGSTGDIDSHINESCLGKVHLSIDLGIGGNNLNENTTNVSCVHTRTSRHKVKEVQKQGEKKKKSYQSKDNKKASNHIRICVTIPVHVIDPTTFPCCSTSMVGSG